MLAEIVWVSPKPNSENYYINAQGCYLELLRIRIAVLQKMLQIELFFINTVFLIALVCASAFQTASFFESALFVD